MPRRVLYSVWRNSDDQLIILDGTTEECCKALGVKPETFYRYACVSCDDTPYSIRKIYQDELGREAEE